jgi:hypothetical protein
VTNVHEPDLKEFLANAQAQVFDHILPLGVFSGLSSQTGQTLPGDGSQWSTAPR